MKIACLKLILFLMNAKQQQNVLKIHNRVNNNEINIIPLKESMILLISS